MTGMSILSPSARICFRQALQKSKVVSTPLQRQTPLLGQVCVRNGGHEKRMVIIPSRFDWQRFKDDFHFYVLLGLVPVLCVVGYANIFIGPATLSDVEEGYEPEEWEYYQSPIKRFFAKYVYQEPQKEYEKTLHYLHQKREERYWNLLDKKVKTLASDRQDYKGWFWTSREKSVAEIRMEAIDLYENKKKGTS